jgi:hypothetical protein
VKTITLWQPWAQLIALKAKTIETRSWPAPRALIGQRIAIHAAQLPPLCTDLQRFAELGHRFDSCPLGKVVASAVLADCVPMVSPAPVDYRAGRILVVQGPGTVDELQLWTCDGSLNFERAIRGQLPLGDFAPGRFAWLLDDIAPTTERCPACWGLGIDSVGAVAPDGGDALCTTCVGHGSCEPIPAKGAQRVWEWTP